MMTAEQSIPFDEVRSGSERLTAESFLALPLPKRVKYILSDDLFFSLDGDPVDKSIALQALRAQRTPS